MFEVGDKVVYRHRGHKMVGTIMKVMRRTASVENTRGLLHNVPLQALEGDA